MEADVATAGEARHAHRPARAHPFSGEPIGVWVANYVLMGYGEGAVMGVPAHDERDFEFAQRHGIPIRTVVQSARGAYERVGEPWQAAYAEYGVAVDSGEFSGLASRAAMDAIAADARSARGWGESACSGGCATGVSRASATGAVRFR